MAKARLFTFLLVLWCSLWASGAAMAQSTATPVVTGYIATTGCPAGLTSCFVQFGSGGGGGGGATSALQTTGNTSLATIATNTATTAAGTTAASALPIQGVTGGVPVPVSQVTSGAPVSFQQTTTSSAVALPSHAATNGVAVCALAANTSTVEVGGSGVTTSAGLPLAAGSCISYSTNNSNLIYIVGNGTDGVAGTAQ